MDITSPLLLVGPTASGKTNLSLILAEILPKRLQIKGVNILVVDSKQVYIGQDIVTGKDIPQEFTLRQAPLSYYSDGATNIYGINLTLPNVSWSLANFLSYAQEVKRISIEQERLLLIIGGTPLYTLALFRTPQTTEISPNQELRKDLGTLTVLQLQGRLQQVDPMRFLKMNPSDRQNPRRLVRAIEIEISNRMRDGWIPAHQKEHAVFDPIFGISQTIWIGLGVDRETQEEQIAQRVSKRLDAGAIDEYKRLLQSYPDWKPEAKSALGYSEIAAFVSKKISREQLQKLWTKHEVQYAKRQMTWWKREKQIRWYESKTSALKEEVLRIVKDWYT